MLQSNFFIFFKFGLTGATTAAIYFLVMLAVESLLGFDYKISVSVAYLLSTLFQFILNRRFTFGTVEGQLSSQAIRYLVMLGINYLLTIVTVVICVERFRLSPYAGVWIALVLTIPTGYFLSRYWIFKTLSI